QAGYYSAVTTYLNVVKKVGTTDGDKVMAELKNTTVNDMFATNGKIRADGLMEHEMYVMQVKTPEESKTPWDYFKVVQKMSGEEAFGKLSDNKTCPLLTQ
ncbi:MAG: ABC transporter substrate-binding protein, partial [Afipia sp.]|nr:ABC transporter substrate-binding protein [Afipia sp.]